MVDMEQQKDLVEGSSDVNPPSKRFPYMDISGSEVRNDKLGIISGDTDVLLREADEDIGTKIDSSTGGEECVRMTEEDHIENSIPQKNHEDEQNAGDQKEQRKEQDTNQGGSDEPPLREVQNQSPTPIETKEADDVHIAALKHAARTLEDPKPAENASACKTKPVNVEQENLSGGSDEPPLRGVPTHLIDCHETTQADTPCLMLPVTSTMEASPKDAIFMCHTELFLPVHVAEIQELMTIGEDVTPVQHKEVKALISEFTNCSAISLSKVNLILGTVHKLNISKDASFHMKTPQHSFNPDQ